MPPAYLCLVHFALLQAAAVAADQRLQCLGPYGTVPKIFVLTNHV